MLVECLNHVRGQQQRQQQQQQQQQAAAGGGSASGNSTSGSRNNGGGSSSDDGSGSGSSGSGGRNSRHSGSGSPRSRSRSGSNGEAALKQTTFRAILGACTMSVLKPRIRSVSMFRQHLVSRLGRSVLMPRMQRLAHACRTPMFKPCINAQTTSASVLSPQSVSMFRQLGLHKLSSTHVWRSDVLTLLRGSGQSGTIANIHAYIHTYIHFAHASSHTLRHTLTLRHTHIPCRSGMATAVQAPASATRNQ